MAALKMLCFYIAWILAVHVQDISSFFEAEINIVGNPSKQTDDWNWQGVASHGNDGNDDDHYENGNSCTATDWGASPWWQVDLGYRQAVTRVDVLNRGNCCPERLAKITVLMADSDYGDDPNTIVTECGYREAEVGSGAWGNISCDQATMGRYMILRLPASPDQLLTVCEVKVWAQVENVLTRMATDTGSEPEVPTFLSLFEENTLQNPSINSAVGAEYVSTELSEKAYFKSPVLECSWNKIQHVRLSFLKDGAEVLKLVFDTSGTADTKLNFYGYQYLHSSNYHDLDSVQYVNDCYEEYEYLFQLAGHDIPKDDAVCARHFFIHCSYGGCDLDIGWGVFLDTNHYPCCTWATPPENHKLPLILYSTTLYKSNAYDWGKADVAMFSADMGDAFGGCISDCSGVSDGDYQSCLACNVYITCSSNSATYQLCKKGTSFDGIIQECNSTSTTCSESGFASDGCYPDGCTPSPCSNSGTCSHDTEGWECTCLTGYTGDTCQTDTCTSGGLCQNGGTCTRNSVDSYSCSCPAGYNGTNCDINIDECEGQTCNNRGTCVDGVDEYTCDCTPGFAGDNCETDIDDCIGVECNNGQCVDEINDYSCNCSAGFEGDACGTNIDDCTPDPCVNGECTDGVNEYSCACDAGFGGTNCDGDVNECDSSPCGSNGECTDGTNSYVCDCDPGYTDDQCTVYDGCHDSPCENGGTCTDGDDLDYTCDCTDDYAGSDCQTQKICSSSSPCDNGTCVDVGDAGTAYSCDCDSGYTGQDCDVLDPCYQTDHCANGGECHTVTDVPGTYYCLCQGGYLPPDCSQADPCYGGTCQYGGNCTTDVSVTPAVANCSCMDGFSGDTCEIGPCEASSSPCSSSQECSNNVDGSGYSCTDSEQGVGSADAQDGEAAQSASVLGSNSFTFYALIAAVAFACLIIMFLIILAVRKKKQREKEDELESNKRNEAWAKEKSEKDLALQKAQNQTHIEKKIQKQRNLRDLTATDVFADF